jgi:hypothetical protein
VTSEIEELKKRKEELELKRDIAKLERRELHEQKLESVSKWSWKWVGPLTVAGLYFLVGGIAEWPGKGVAVPIGLVMLSPAFLKIFNKR